MQVGDKIEHAGCVIERMYGTPPFREYEVWMPEGFCWGEDEAHSRLVETIAEAREVAEYFAGLEDLLVCECD